MEFLGLFALLILLMYSSYPGKVKKLEREIKKLKKKNTEGQEMSKLINDLVGKKCKITNNDGGMIDIGTIVIIDSDLEWVKIEKTNKKNIKTIEIIRIDDISKITIEEV